VVRGLWFFVSVLPNLDEARGFRLQEDCKAATHTHGTQLVTLWRDERMNPQIAPMNADFHPKDRLFLRMITAPWTALLF
jgi:hypothetical protein